MNRKQTDVFTADATVTLGAGATASEPATARAQWLSAAMDGELTAEEMQAFQALCAADTAQNGSVQQDWHSYTAIGEALRETNARCAVCDSGAFMAQLRQRLHSEEAYHCSADWLETAAGSAAVADTAANDSRFWKRAAGFASMAAVTACAALLWLSQAGTQPVLVAGGDTGDGTGDASVRVVEYAVPVSGVQQPADVTAAAGQWEPDARWEEYLRTHRQYAGDPYWSDRRRAGVQRTGFQGGR